MSNGRLVLTNLVKEFGNSKDRIRAVDDLSLVIEPGEFVTLLGPSGCGKTTTLRMIAGFETPSSGSISLDGEDLVRLSPDRRPMGMVFQSYALFPHMSVFENVAYGLRVKKMSANEIKSAVKEVLDSMSLSQLANRAPNQLSGGQQQRVALARAMVTRPKVLLFDEPLSNLDAKLRAQMRIEIRTIQRQLGITSVFVTHDQDEAMSLSDRIVVMRNAVVEQAGTPEEIYRKPNSVFVADFIGRSNFLKVGSVEILNKNSAKISIQGKSFDVAAHPSITEKSKVVLLLRPESISLSRSSGVGRGKITNVVFYGAHVEYALDTEDGVLNILQSDPIFDEIFKVGDDVQYDFDPSRAWLLPDSK